MPAFQKGPILPWSPVPSPVGFVVTKGWNNLSRISGAMPVPLSRTRTSISWDIVTQQHGGVIEVDSRIDEFTEFTIRLPLAYGATIAEPAA